MDVTFVPPGQFLEQTGTCRCIYLVGGGPGNDVDPDSDEERRLGKGSLEVDSVNLMYSL